MRTTIFIFILTIAGFSKIFSQTSPGDIVTDRPDQTESAVITPKNHIQIESGISYSRQSVLFLSFLGFEVNADYYTVPTVLFRYGLEPFIELRLNAEYLTGKIKTKINNSVINEDTKSGLQPIQIGAKLKLFETASRVTKGALLVSGDIPAFATGDFTDMETTLEGRFLFQTAHKDGLALGINVGMEYTPDNGEKVYLYTIAPSFGFNDKLGGFIELYGFYYNTPDEFNNYLDGGLTYLLAPNMQLDLSAGILFSANTHYFISSGFSVRLPR